MREKIAFQEWDREYKKTVNKIYEFWNADMQLEIAKFNWGWHPELYDFKTYLDASTIRYYKAYTEISAKNNIKTVCDVGGFWGVFPTVLVSLGYEVTMTETLKYYSKSFDPLFEFIASKNVKIVDHDPFEQNCPLPGDFDFVTVMAVLEHYPHSLKYFFNNVTSNLKANGYIYIEVPNIAYWPKRIQLLKGKSPITPIYNIFFSEVPFIGHHHEFSREELRKLAQWADLEILNEISFNYSNGSNKSIRQLLRPIETIVYVFFDVTRECLGMTCKPITVK